MNTKKRMKQSLGEKIFSVAVYAFIIILLISFDFLNLLILYF